MGQSNFDGRKLIAFPRYHHYNIAIRYLIEQGIGAKYLELPEATRETVDLGSKYSPDYACAPFKHTLGSLIEACNAGADVLIEVGGLCRLDYYGALQNEILKELGYEVEFVDLAIYMVGKKKDWLKLAKSLSPKYNLAKLMNGLYDALKMVEHLDEVEAYYHKYACYETEKGSFRRIHQKFLRDMQVAETRNEIKEGYMEAIHAMEELPRIEGTSPIQIGIVGEYYTAMDAHSNLNLEEKLINLGCSIERFVSVTNLNLKTKEKTLRPKIREYVNYNMGATVTWTINAALGYANRGFDGIIHVKSFGCTPETDAVPVLQNISKDYHIPVLYLSYDTQTSDTGLDTRLEAFCDMLERKKKVLR